MKIPKRLKRLGKLLYFYLQSPTQLVKPLEDIVVETQDGIKFYCSYDNLIERKILKGDLFEPEVTACIREQISPGWTIFDIGANIGYHSLLFSKLAGEAGHIHCFEPTKYASTRFAMNMQLNESLPKNIIMNRLGLDATEDRRTEAIESRFSLKIPAYSEMEETGFTTLDSYCERNLINNIDMIKIDVDGYDFGVVVGGKSILQACKPLMIAEFNNRELVRHGHNLSEYVTLLMEVGYDDCIIFDQDRTRMHLEQLLDCPNLQTLSTNALLLN